MPDLSKKNTVVTYMMIPSEVQDIIYRYLHNLYMTNITALIVKGGLSTFEDLPDLVDTFNILASSDDEAPGWSGRVSEFKTNLHDNIMRDSRQI
tara:strand:+ start:5268 stop:5549 length:282 start_codon:yes stop_codon:yes gene_type:complete